MKVLYNINDDLHRGAEGFHHPNKLLLNEMDVLLISSLADLLLVRDTDGTAYSFIVIHF